MSIPNLKHIVQSVRDSHAWDFSIREGLCAYSNAVVVALHEADPDFGHLLKSSGQNHCLEPGGRRRAVDAALYKPTGQAVDFIGNAGVGSANTVTWGTGDPEGKYGPDKWFAPMASGEPVPVPIPDLPPEDLTLENLQRQVDGLIGLLQVTGERVIGLEQLHGEVNKQLGLINEAIADLSGRYAGHHHEVSLGRFDLPTGGPQ